MWCACAGSAPGSDDEGGASGSGSDSEEPSGEQQGQDSVVRDAAVSDLDYLRSRMRANFDLDDGAGQPAGAPGGGLAGSSGAEGSSDLDSDRESEGAAGDDSSGEERKNVGGKGSTAQRAATTVKRPAGPERQQQQQRQQQRARLKAGQPGAADAAEDELGAIFGRAVGRRGGGSGGGEHGDGGSSDMEELDSEADSDIDKTAAPMEEEDLPSEDDQQAGGSNADAGADAAQQAQRGRGAVLEVEAGGEASIGETGRLFVRNLPYSATEADLRQLFERFGEVAEAHLVLDK